MKKHLWLMVICIVAFVAGYSINSKAISDTGYRVAVVDVQTLIQKSSEVNSLKANQDKKLDAMKATVDKARQDISKETDPTKIEVTDIGKSHHCPLAHMLRKRLHKFGIRSGFWAVFSPAPVRDGAMIIAEETNKKSNVGTISYIPAAFGCVCSSVVIRDLIGEM